MKILLISPETPTTFWSFKYALKFISKKAAFPPLGLLTVAAMMPSEWDYRLVDLNVRRLDDGDLRWADFVMIGAMLVHADSVREIVSKCVAFSKPLIGGGPLFTTGYESFPEIEHFVLGEAEDVMPELVKNMREGRLRKIYQATHFPDVTKSPVPRWDLIDMRFYANMGLQFSRGCPFDCEFCDIVVMNGRVARTKTPEQFVSELDSLRKAGWDETVFVVDDNFIGNKQHARELLHALVAWRRRTGTRMDFFTEASINLADDPELCRLMVKAGFDKVFVGIETPSLEALKECHKVQNVNRDLVMAVRALQQSGLEVMGGFIVGFDNDPSDIFRRQFEFIQGSGVVTAMVGLLTALPQTRLWARLKHEGRLETESTGNNTSLTLNFMPRLNREFLQSGYRELMRTLYEPETYYRRVRIFLENHQSSGPGLIRSAKDLFAVIKTFWVLGVCHRGRLAYWKLIGSILMRSPRKLSRAIELAILGFHFRRVADSL